MSRRVGRVRWFSETKGFGFIEREDGISVFFHTGARQASGLQTMEDGALVEFEVLDEGKGQQADFVMPLSAPEARARLRSDS